jgi:tetratricopeptide (TPR) repeat protein
MTPEAFRGELQACLGLLNAGRAADARPRIDALIAARPEQPDPYALLGLALDQLGEAEAGAVQLRRAIAINPRQPQYRLQLARMIAPTDLAAAEASLRAALEAAPGHPPALEALIDLLAGAGRGDEAVALSEAHLPPPTPERLQAHSRLLKRLERYDEAVAVARRIVGMAPSAGGAQHNLAAALTDAGQPVEAVGAIRAAMALGQDGAETWRVLARALEDDGKFDDAEAAYREAIARRPDDADVHADLSQLIWMRTGDVAKATAGLARHSGPGGALMAVQHAKILENAGDVPGALAVLIDALSGEPNSPLLLSAAAHAAGGLDPARALDWATAAAKLAPKDRGVLTGLCEARLAVGDAEAAAGVAETLVRTDPRDQLALALQATAWRLDGDPRAAALNDYSLVRSYRLAPPPGWDSLAAYLTELEYVLATLHGMAFHPVGQSLRHGTQTTTDLRRGPAGSVQAFLKAIAAPIGEHLAWLGQGADPVRARNVGGYRVAGCWSVRLRPGGFHTDHVHPRGWLSSAFYVDVPPAIEEGRQGWLKFGEPGMPTNPPLAPEHFVKPEPGLLVLFPSYMWHGTVPFEGAKPRLSIAFDLVPDVAGR